MSKDILVLVDFDPEIDPNPYRSLKLSLKEKHPNQNIIFWGFPKFSDILFKFDPKKEGPSKCLLEDIFLTVYDHKPSLIYIYKNYLSQYEILDIIKKIQISDISFFKKYYFVSILDIENNIKHLNNLKEIYINFDVFNYSLPSKIILKILIEIQNFTPIFISVKRPAHTCKTTLTIGSNKKIVIINEQQLIYFEQEIIDYLLMNNVSIKIL